MSQNVTIRSADTEIAVPSGQIILQTALDAGINYPHGCRSGRCGACKSRLVSGDVELLEHTEFALSPDEPARGLILACRALPQTDACVAWLGGDSETADHPRRTLTCRVARLDDATHESSAWFSTSSRVHLWIIRPGSMHRSRFRSAHPRLLDGQSRR